MIECAPIVSDEVEKVALPADSAPVPRIVAPSLKVTVPVAAEGETVAVNVTDVPRLGVDEDGDKVVVVTCADAAETVDNPAKSPSTDSASRATSAAQKRLAPAPKDLGPRRSRREKNRNAPIKIA